MDNKMCYTPEARIDGQQVVFIGTTDSDGYGVTFVRM